ncbi:MAG: hypothetical protein LKI94_09855 [Sporolactobacillus sp.]|nr:hypothetical protein [Sporolactobacillus sp.]
MIPDRQFGGKIPFPLYDIATYLISAHFSIVLEWLGSGTEEPAAAIAALIRGLALHGALHGLKLI